MSGRAVISQIEQIAKLKAGTTGTPRKGGGNEKLTLRNE
jgi:hypothetical protein